MSHPNGAYISGLFSDHRWIGGPTLDQMVASDFNLYVFWAMHVDAEGNLFYNNEPLISNGTPHEAASHIREFIAAGRAKGKLQTAYMSVGGWGVADFANIATIYAAGGTVLENFKINLQSLKSMGVDGVDYDYEESISDPVGTMTSLTKTLHALGMSVTYCPYTNEAMWIDCLKSTFSALGTQPVQAFNLQCYAGGGGNEPKNWVDILTEAGPGTGVENPNTFVRPGLAVAGSASFPQMTPNQMKEYLQNQPGNAAWIWNTEEALKSGKYSLAEYAAAIAAGS